MDAAVERIIESIRREADGLGPVRIMEVCGTHADTIHRNGIPSVLPPNIQLVSGPGCPVCVTPRGYIDAALRLAERGITIATFGDMVRVPGSRSSLERAKANGADVRVVYSPKDALRIAEEREVVFLGVGFETTAAPVAAAVMEAERRRLRRFRLFSTHKTVPPALAALFIPPAGAVNAAPAGVKGLICPGHVSVIIGAKAYRPLAADAKLACVIAGFEPEDILAAVMMIVRQLRSGATRVEVEYRSWVKDDGNQAALQLIETVFEECGAEWRGLGSVPGSGLRLRERFADYDAERVYGLAVESVPDPAGCQCAEVIRGVIAPPECTLFGKVCRPDSPIGPCMVSAEGSCAIRYKYRIHRRVT